ncbi:acyl-CoA synthetase family protein [Flexibacterium corallicola]|uniref:AMP-binding protein n=1 Tax=Flexibacterium corallicola TaxID=3037259 RepID=UPI00286ED373|nr:AMP-binding protein [Pseudovibrio sp. M1P-2-3]
MDPDSCMELPQGSVGEIWLSGPSTTSGYWNKPELTSQVFQVRKHDDDNGCTWLRTGDLGALRNGQLYVLGRLKEMVIIRGQNYFAADLEITANSSDSLLGHDHTIAFGVEREEREELVFVHELSRSSMKRFQPSMPPISPTATIIALWLPASRAT